MEKYIQRTSFTRKNINNFSSRSRVFLLNYAMNKQKKWCIRNRQINIIIHLQRSFILNSKKRNLKFTLNTYRRGSLTKTKSLIYLALFG